MDRSDLTEPTDGLDCDEGGEVHLRPANLASAPVMTVTKVSAENAAVKGEAPTTALGWEVPKEITCMPDGNMIEWSSTRPILHASNFVTDADDGVHEEKHYLEKFSSKARKMKSILHSERICSVRNASVEHGRSVS